jgi:hypothetical protein
MDSINKQLQELYLSKWSDISETLIEIADGDPAPEPTNPLLIHINREKEWVKADVRVMIFGQETQDWEQAPGKSIEHLCDVYHRFFNENHGKPSQFWNGFARFETILGAKYPDKKIRYVWNNIIKIGKEDAPGRPPQNIYNAERQFFHVIPDEVKILNPNIILFLTGPNYDDVIRDNFGEDIYSLVPPYSERQLAKVSIPAVDFAFRTYHPNWLWRNDIDSYFNEIIKNIIL